MPDRRRLGDASHRVTFTLVASNFAGDESLLIEETFGIQTQYHALVRRGDVEAELRYPHWSDSERSGCHRRERGPAPLRGGAQLLTSVARSSSEICGHTTMDVRLRNGPEIHPT